MTQTDQTTPDIPAALRAMVERAEKASRSLPYVGPTCYTVVDCDLPRVARALLAVWEECEKVNADYRDGQCSPGRWDEARKIQAIITKELSQ